jgi:hypothetical protein
MFRITGLDPAPFRPLFGLPDADLARLGARRIIADRTPGFPDRIEMRDAVPGETMLLLNYTHQPADTPFRANHAIFVREGAARRYDTLGKVPEVMRRRLISLRAFDPAGDMLDADAAEGDAIATLIEQMLEIPKTAYLHAHYAKPGCYAARIERA